MRAVQKTHCDEIYALKKESSEVRDECSARAESLKEVMQRKLDDVEAEQTVLRQTWERRRVEFEGRIELLVDDIECEKKASQVLRDQVGTLRQQLADLNAVLCNERHDFDGVHREMLAEMTILRGQLESARATEAALHADKRRLLDELDAYRRELVELRAKFCAATDEKDKLLKEIVELNKAVVHDDSAGGLHFKLDEKLDQLQARLDKTKRLSSVGLTEESIGTKIDTQIEAKVGCTFRLFIFSSSLHRRSFSSTR